MTVWLVIATNSDKCNLVFVSESDILDTLMQCNLRSCFTPTIYYGVKTIGHNLCERNEKRGNFRPMIVHQDISEIHRMILKHLVQHIMRRSLQKM